MVTDKADRVRSGGELAARVGAILEATAPATRRAEVVADALADSGHRTIPESPEELLFFATGPLYERAQAAWGSEIADAILLELAPVLDRAWERDRRELVGELTPSGKPGSGVRLRSEVLHLLDSSSEGLRRACALDAERAEDADTVPAPAPEPTHPPEDEVTRRRITVPYTSVAWSKARNTPRVLVLASDDELRARIAGALRGQRYALATAAHREGARALYTRLEPDLVVAERETLAPDYEPLRPAVEALFGASRAAKVVLVTEEPVRDRFDSICAVIRPDVSQDALVVALRSLLDS
ncbi:MAG TPA: hypothetical protein VFB62_04490 [Polyangiaceae bacterium]|nr:hypothetical protein [Polyangiaceae bacterium]